PLAPEPLERSLDRRAEPVVVEALARRIGRAIGAALRHDRDLWVVLLDLRQHLLRAPAAVRVRGVEEREADVDGAANHGLRVGRLDLAVRIAREAPRAERELR